MLKMNGVILVRRRIKWFLTKLHCLPDDVFLRLAYWLETGRKLDLRKPITFCDKLSHIKLHGGTKRYAPLVDKLAVRAFVTKTVGAEHLIPLIASYTRPEHIVWHELPDRFVVKCTHGSHCGIMVTDKARFDTAWAVKRLNKWLRTNWYWFGREPPYRAVPPRIVIEEMLGDGITQPINYKIMCFDGEPEIVQLHKRSGPTRTIDFFTAWGDRLNMRKSGIPNSIGLPNAVPAIDRRKLQDMLPVARQLARATGAPYVRIDLYHEQGRVWFSELTFFDSAGFRDFQPLEVNKKLGDMIKLKEGIRA